MRIKELRAARKMTQEDLARATGLSRVHIARVESGNYDPRLSTVQAIAKALRVKVGKLVE